MLTDAFSAERAIASIRFFHPIPKAIEVEGMPTACFRYSVA